LTAFRPLALFKSFSIYIEIKMGVQLPDLKFTSLEVIPERISTVRKSFLENKTRDVEFRLVQLRKLYWA
jgi:beta-apo-4'-carotenal oxygenase